MGPTGLTPDYLIRTEHLLRPWRMDEVDTYLRLKRDPDVVRYLYGDPLTPHLAAAKLASLHATVTDPGQWTNAAIFGILAAEWAARRSRRPH